MRNFLGGRNFIFIIFLVLIAGSSIRNALNSGMTFGDWAIGRLMILPGIIIGLTVHEFAHAYSAWKLGDQTPKVQGRVTLNPISHIDPMGIITLIFVGFGWGKPVQVNPYAFKKHPRLSNILVDVSGVITNFIIAFLCYGLLLALVNAGLSSSVGFTIVYYIVFMNLVLMIFNLLPIPPLDGFGIVTEIFNLRRFSWYQTFYSNGTLILLVLIMFDIVSQLLTPALTALLTFIQNIWSFILF